MTSFEYFLSANSRALRPISANSFLSQLAGQSQYPIPFSFTSKAISLFSGPHITPTLYFCVMTLAISPII